ncbi:MAG: 50S ribosomal protein L29 [Endomicrobiales bacterium]|nr:50S ribosomal protein L29 [Endomicrobiales bacterium]
MKAKQWQETRELSQIEMEAKLRAAQEELFRLRFKHTTTPLKNGLKIRALRRNIAQFKTLLREKNQTAQAGK